MPQPSVTAFFNSRKRQASDEIRNKSKVLILDRSTKNTPSQKIETISLEKTETEGRTPQPISGELSQGPASPKLVYATSFETDIARSASRAKMTPKASARIRATRAKKFALQEGQTDIRDTLAKMNADSPNQATPKVIPFEKMGLLSPRKKNPSESATTNNETAMDKTEEAPAAGSITPKKSLVPERLSRRELNLGEIKKRINTSSRLNELKASIARFRKCEEKIEQLEKKHESNKPQIRKFQSIEVEVPLR